MRAAVGTRLVRPSLLGAPSSRIKAFPHEDAARVAVTTSKAVLDENPGNPLLVRFVCYEHDLFVADGGYAR